VDGNFIVLLTSRAVALGSVERGHREIRSFMWGYMNFKTEAAQYFESLLVDLGEVENPAFMGVLSPLPEVGLTREGVGDVFLRDAEKYYEQHAGFAYWKACFTTAFSKITVPSGGLMIEFGCGFGNATLPLLELLPQYKIVATDISPNQLSILRRLLDAGGHNNRCVPVAMDAHRPYIKPDSADLVCGSAILHHLVEPARFIEAAMRVLKPGGYAVFFEPLEVGYALIRMLCLDIAAEAEQRGEQSVITTWMKNFGDVLDIQIKRERRPGWHQRDDKWVYPRSVLQRIADEKGAELVVHPNHSTTAPFRMHITSFLQSLGAHDPTLLPQWAWAKIDRMDNDIFSPEGLADVLVTGCVMFRKRLAVR
jgi:ubiquinone/menaquinone biosynthesis C-methylase UbiE